MAAKYWRWMLAQMFNTSRERSSSRCQDSTTKIVETVKKAEKTRPVHAIAIGFVSSPTSWLVTTKLQSSSLYLAGWGIRNYSIHWCAGRRLVKGKFQSEDHTNTQRQLLECAHPIEASEGKNCLCTLFVAGRQDCARQTDHPTWWSTYFRKICTA